MNSEFYKRVDDLYLKRKGKKKSGWIGCDGFRMDKGRSSESHPKVRCAKYSSSDSHVDNIRCA